MILYLSRNFAGDYQAMLMLSQAPVNILVVRQLG